MGGAGRAVHQRPTASLPYYSERKKAPTARVVARAARGRRPGKAEPPHSKPPPNRRPDLHARRHARAWLRGGNVSSPTARTTRELTRTGDATALLTFLGIDRVAFRAGKRVLAVDLGSGLVSLLATLETVADPDEPEKKEGSANRRSGLFAS